MTDHPVQDSSFSPSKDTPIKKYSPLDPPDRTFITVHSATGLFLFLAVLFVVFACIFVSLRPVIANFESAVLQYFADFEDSTLNDLPENGQIFYRRSPINYHFAHCRIKAPESGHYYVKLKDHETGLDVVSFFVRSDHTANIEIPSGTFDVFFAAGEIWYGEDKLFGEETVYFKVDGPFTPTTGIGNTVTQGAKDLAINIISAADF